MADDMIKLGVLWKNVSRNGNKPYLSGRVNEENLDAAVERLRNGGRFLVLGSNKRPDKKDPDCNLFVVLDQDRPGKDSGEGAAPRTQGSIHPPRPTSPRPNRSPQR